MDEDYLEKVTFNILDAHPTDPSAKVIESYSFRVTSTVDVAPKGGKSTLNLAVSKKQTVAGSTITTSSTKKGMVSKDEVHAAMQQLVRTLLVRQMPAIRWLSTNS
jgi:hypothetical protein